MANEGAWRRQLTLFVPSSAGEAIEALRRRLDPVQHGLIAAHVTLCREEDLGSTPTSVLVARLSSTALRAVTLRFGAPERFHEHGILLPCIEGQAALQALRAQILGSGELRAQTPHITLAHPRNPRAEESSLELALRLPTPLTIRFDAVSAIEQRPPAPWQTVATVPLAAP